MSERLDLHRVFQLRGRLHDGLVSFVGVELDTESVRDFTDEAHKYMPGVPYQAMFHSCRVLGGQTLNTHELFDFCWLLAGNLARLRRGEAVYAWEYQAEPELMPAQVLSHRFTRTKFGKPAGEYTMRILAGSACPMVVTKLWTTKFVSYLARKVFGFSPPWGNYPYHTQAELVRLRLMVEVDQEFCYNGEPGFGRVDCASGLITWNRKVMVMRDHAKTPCPFEFTHNCVQCPIGYDRCKAAVHPKTYRLAVCRVCKEDTYHDPDDLTGLCMKCVSSSLV